MSVAQTYPPCPICNKENNELALKSFDFSLTKEPFDIIYCSQCTLQYTHPVPSKSEIAKYYQFTDYISHTDTKKGWLNTIYHFVRQFTLHQKSSLIQSLFPNKLGKILDIGSGTGAFANKMKSKGWEVVALEPDESSRLKAFENYGLKVDPIDHFFNLPDQSFDVISLWHVLEHVHDLNDYLIKFYSLLNTNGKLIIAVPNYTSFDAQYYKHMWAAYDVPRHLYHFSPASLETLCVKHHLKVTKHKAMWFDSYYVSLLTEKYINWKLFGTLRAMIVSTVSNLVAVFNNQRASSVIYIIEKK